MANTETIAVTLQKICNGFPLCLWTRRRGTVYPGACQIRVTIRTVVVLGLGLIGTNR